MTRTKGDRAASFIVDWPDMFQKLREEVESFKEDPISTRHAVNFALTAWHFHDWLWARSFCRDKALQAAVFGEEFADLTAFRVNLKKNCPALAYIENICDASKHTRHSGEAVKESIRIEVPFGSGNFGDGLYGGGLLVITCDGKELPYNDLVSAVMDYWTSVIDRLNAAGASESLVASKEPAREPPNAC